MDDFTINGAHNLDIRGMDVIPDESAFLKLSGATVTRILSEYGDLIFQEWKSDTFSIWLSQYHLRQTATLYGVVNQPIIEMQFVLSEGAEYLLGGVGTVKMPNYSFNFCSGPYGENSVVMPKGTKFTTFDVHLTMSFVQTLGELFPLLDPFINRALKGYFSLYNSKAVPASANMIYLMNTILQGSGGKNVQHRRVQNLTEILLLEAFELMTVNLPETLKPSRQEIETLGELRDFLVTNLDSQLTIVDLARKFAMNECKLKKHFKTLYGSSIHQFRTQERMTKACELLITGDMQISEIAYMVGFSTPGTFIESFQKEFGMSPLQFRKRKK